MRTRSHIPAVLLGLLFLIQGSCFVSRPGIGAAELAWDPVKAAFYAVLLLFAQPSAAALRFPLLVVGATTVVLAYKLLQRLDGGTAAIAGGLLLATDTTFLLSTRLDAARSVLAHLLLVAGCLFVLRFWRTVSRPSLALGFLCFGLGCASRLELAWVFCGSIAASLIVFPSEVRAVWGRRNLLPAVAGLLAGLAPLLARSRPRVPLPNASLISFFDGSVWFGYTFRNQPGTWGVGPHSFLEAICVHAAAAFSQPRHNLLAIAFGAGLIQAVVVLFLRPRNESRSLRFAVIALILSSALILLFGHAHDDVLVLWPLPHLVFGFAFAAAIQRWVISAVPLAAALLVIVCSSVAVTSTAYSRALLFGGTPDWTEAIFHLAENFDVHDARHIRVLSPGIEEPLQFLKRGTLPVDASSFADTLYIARTDFATQTLQAPGKPPRQVRFLRYVQDDEGRSVFELFRLE